MHVRSVTLHPQKYPVSDFYPFNLDIFHQTRNIKFNTPLSLFIGENGTGKSTLLEAIAHKCGIYIWHGPERRRFENNPYEDLFFKYISIDWINNRVPGSFFGSSVFHDFVQILDEWASADPALLDLFGGRSLVTQSHGQSILSFFRSRYKIKGLYLMDEPETALSPKSQIELTALLTEMASQGHAQFIIATHSPILLACPGATIYSFDHIPVRELKYEETEIYKIYKNFMEDRRNYI